MTPVALARIGVAGTRHGAGATTVAAAIIAGMYAAGMRVAGIKPVACGPGDDAARLRAAARAEHPLSLVAPVRFDEPVAPLVAARRARTAVDLGAIDQAFAALTGASDAIVADGTGPLLTPITETESFATLFRRWELGLVIVASNGRDAVGEVLAAVEAARANALTLQAVVLTVPAPHPSRPTWGDTAERTNQAVLKEMLRTVPVIALPHTPSPDDPDTLAALAREFAARAAFTRPA